MSAEDWKDVARAVSSCDTPHLQRYAEDALERLAAEVQVFEAARAEANTEAEEQRTRAERAEAERDAARRDFAAMERTAADAYAQAERARREERQRVSDELRRQSCPECANAVLDMGDE
jgi:hypothetical protein